MTAGARSGAGERWHMEVPGTRYLRADLHLHTIDDPNVRLPDALQGQRDAPETQERYACRFLDASVEQGIEVLGLTPHAGYLTPGSSAVWAIMDLWQTGVNADGRSYRDLIYAVYPGFEPSFGQSPNAIHLIFLFDPSIGAGRYQQVFSSVMDGRDAYDGSKRLQRTPRTIAQALHTLDSDNVVGRGNYVVIAAHPCQKNGLFKCPDHVISDTMRGRVDAAELSRNKTLAAAVAGSGKLKYAQRRGLALYHASDAKSLPAPGAVAEQNQLGHRSVLVKLASPTIQSLRQALLARDSRIVVPFVEDETNDGLVFDSSIPPTYPAGPDVRPWLREVTVEGGTSFHAGQVFRFSPDLTCIIGGSMTGKSTLIDGLRMYLGGEAGLPGEAALRKAVGARAEKRFLSGGPTIHLDSPAGELTVPVPERCPMKFFSQGELKSLADDDDGIEELLFHLIPGLSDDLLAQKRELAALDERLSSAVVELSSLREEVEEAEQSWQRASEAREAMKRFEKAGTEKLPPAEGAVARATGFAETVGGLAEQAEGLASELEDLTLPELPDAILAGDSGDEASVPAQIADAHDLAKALSDAIDRLRSTATGISSKAADVHRELLSEVQRALVDSGGSADDLNEFDSYARTAQNYEALRSTLEARRTALTEAQGDFDATLAERAECVERHREAVAKLREQVGSRFETLRVEVQPEGRHAAVEAWVDTLRKRGVTRWWRSGSAPATGALSGLQRVAEALDEDDRARALTAASSIGMSDQVADTLLEVLASRDARLGLRAQRAPDRFRLQWIEEGRPIDIDKLSGGRRVAVLLMLLLVADDPTPLVIDQPEDELDNRFLNETIIPALHSLKGRRQVILATHNANIVVNGDADRVIALEANADGASIYAEGAIEEEPVRDAIVKTLDGGRDAFKLRLRKYGF